MRPYVPGDDVRRIDWNVTARTGEPHVRVDLAERVLVTWLVLDTSVSMQFGTADRRKADVAEGVAVAIGHLATRRGNRLGVVTFGGEESRAIPPMQGRAGLVGMLTALRSEPAVDGRARLISLLRSVRQVRSLVSARSSWSSPTSGASMIGDARSWGSPGITTSSRSRFAIYASRSSPTSGFSTSWIQRPEGSSGSIREAAGCASGSPSRQRRSAHSSHARSHRPASGTWCSRRRVTGCARWSRSCAGAVREVRLATRTRGARSSPRDGCAVRRPRSPARRLTGGVRQPRPASERRRPQPRTPAVPPAADAARRARIHDRGCRASPRHGERSARGGDHRPRARRVAIDEGEGRRADTHLDAARVAAKTFLDEVPEKFRVGVVSFATCRRRRRADAGSAA